MRVALIGTYNKEETGPSRVTGGLAKGLHKKGLDVDIFVHGNRTTPPDGVDLHHLGDTPDSVFGFIKMMKNASERIHQGTDYEIVHPLEEFHRPTDVRTIQWTSGEYERLRRAPEDFSGGKALLGDIILNVINMFASKFTNDVVAQSPITAGQMNNHWKASPDHVIPLGIQKEWLSAPHRMGSPLKIMMVGRLTQKKGQYDILRDLKRSPSDYDMTIVGSTSNESYSSKMSEWEEDMVGFVDRNRLEKLYEDHDIVVVPSRHENFSVVALEAIAKGCGLVITDTCGFARFPEVAESDGVQVVSSYTEMTEGINSLQDRDIQKMKWEAYDLAKSFTWNKVADDYIKIYEYHNCSTRIRCGRRSID